MGCWNLSFYDNDECFEFLVILFSLLGIRPAAENRLHVVAMIPVPPEYGHHHRPLIVRHTEEELDEIPRLLKSLTAASILEAKRKNPKLEAQLLEACRRRGLEEGDGLAKLGLKAEHLWTLIHMHVGLPVEDTSRLDSLAQAFATRSQGGTFNIDSFLSTFSGIGTEELEKVRDALAPHLRAGVLLFKQFVATKKHPLPAMKLACFGPKISMFMWLNGALPHGLLTSLQTNLNIWSGTPNVITTSHGATVPESPQPSQAPTPRE